MRALWIVARMPVAAQAARVEVEVAPAWARSTDVDAAAAVLRARAGVELPWFTPSITVFEAFLSDLERESGLNGWAVAAEGRFHTNGVHRFVAAGAAGWGRLSLREQSRFETQRYTGEPALYLHGAIGYQYALHPLRVGVELTWDRFDAVHFEGETAASFCFNGTPLYPQCPGDSSTLVGFAVTLGYAF